MYILLYTDKKGDVDFEFDPELCLNKRDVIDKIGYYTADKDNGNIFRNKQN